MLRVVERVGGYGVDGMVGLRGSVEAVVRVGLGARELAVAVLVGRGNQQDRPQGEGFARARDALRLVHVAWVHLACELQTTIILERFFCPAWRPVQKN